MVNQTAKELFLEYRGKAQIEVNKFCQIQVYGDPMYKILLKSSAQRLMCLAGLWQAIASRINDQKYYQEG